MKLSMWIPILTSIWIMNAGLWIYHDLRSLEKPNFYNSNSLNRKSRISSHTVCIVGN